MSDQHDLALGNGLALPILLSGFPNLNGKDIHVAASVVPQFKANCIKRKLYQCTDLF